ncbi:MAG: transpeptidase family protein [Bacteroidales bacterium]|nr:transpeptidase family protein [Bacteroidales bacterium]MDE7072340.1 transpeptidase family protein [Bacteroidales bacterium]
MTGEKRKSEKQHDGKTGFWWKVYLIYAGLLLFAVAIAIRMVDVIFGEGQHLLELSHRQSLRYEETPAVRGNIYSADNSLLAVSVPYFTLRMDMHPSVVSTDTFYKYLRPLCDSLHRMYPQRSSESYRQWLIDGRKRGKRDFLLRANVTYAEMTRIRQFPILKKGQFRGGFIVEEKDRRIRPHGELAKRTLGYYNTESDYRVGLEGAYHKELRGVNGRRLTQKVSNGVWRPVYTADAVVAENGKDIVTTIDIRIQDVAESALQECMELNEAEHGCVVLMEVKTGKVVAIANLRKEADGRYTESMNYAIGEAVEPGSTFKLASAIAILEESHCDTTVKVPTGRRKFHNRWMNDSHREGWGDLSFAGAFEKSSNVGISFLADTCFPAPQRKKGEKIGAKEDKRFRFVEYLRRMHLDKPLGVEIAGEGVPYIKDPSDKTWSGISLPWMSIGYEVNVTPLQILALYNAVANNGKMMKPMFVSEIRKGDERVKLQEPEVLVDRICSSATLAKVQGMLEGVVERGTAMCLKNSLYKVAAKTGTAQINYGKSGEKMTYRASIVGYFPADAPRYSCIVMITNPRHIYGGAVAGPVFKEIADKVYATLMKGGLETERFDPAAALPLRAAGYAADISRVGEYLGMRFPELEPSSFVRMSGGTNRFAEVNTMKEVMPDVRGMGLRDAVFLLEKYGLKISVSGKGWVKSQTPAAGTACRKGQTVVLEMAS